MNVKFAEKVFRFAAIYGFAVVTPQYLLEKKIGLDHPPAINHPEYFYGFVGVAFAWQVAFLIISKDPVRYRALMIPSMLEKISFFLAAVVLYSLGRMSGAVLPFAVMDLVFVVLFWMAWQKTEAV